MIAIVDYRAGNLTSVQAAVAHLGFDCRITRDAEEIRHADRVIFPGVGAAGAAMRNLHCLSLAGVLREVVDSGVPFLGICVGFQLLFEHSAEDDQACLGFLPGRVVRFRDDMVDPGTGRHLKVPHMGWNAVTFGHEHPLWSGVPAASEFYFVHSYYPVPGAAADVGGTAEYGVEFAAAVVRGNLAACQFHPEKSGRPGLTLLRNFCTWSPV